MKTILKAVGFAACIVAGAACVATLIANSAPKPTHRYNPATGTIEEVPV